MGNVYYPLLCQRPFLAESGRRLASLVSQLEVMVRPNTQETLPVSDGGGTEPPTITR